MRTKNLVGLLLTIFICIFGVLSWYYIYLPNKEMSELKLIENKLVHDIYIINTSYKNDTEMLNDLLKMKNMANEIKKEIVTLSVDLRSEKAKKASSVLLMTAEYTERWCTDSWIVGNGMSKGTNISEKEFEKHLNSLYKTQDKLHDELIPLLEGYFKNY